MKKLTYLFLALLIVACSDDEGNLCNYSPTLTTSAVTNIRETAATLNGMISIVSENCDNPTNTEQGFVYATSIQPTTANNKVNVNGADITTTLENLEPNTTYYARTFLTNSLGEFYGNEESFITSEGPIDCEVVYLAENGITIKACDDANLGDTGVIGGITYTVVDETILRELVANEADVTQVVTSKVTDMSYLFYNSETFNQDISSWDVSKVTNMEIMFDNTGAFNQSLDHWEVSNVTNMYGMFYFAQAFDQAIGSWDVSQVTNMSYMFSSSIFNQDLNNWDVSQVTDMTHMFSSALFNQNIGNWEVGQVSSMEEMFYGARAFNQDIGSWDVRNVTNMTNMFIGSTPLENPFNQDLSSWEVNSVTSMSGMFAYSAFNQDISNWEVGAVVDMSAMFLFATAFNQDLSAWNVSSISECDGFNLGTPQWVLPKPNLDPECLN
ncbi:BspA family leucine-rich repeat surface protein [Flavobacteriaceae bacterium]|nr:BspA family leucine-rich repeat surface protein [Flavobacteriaceae bacterium]